MVLFEEASILLVEFLRRERFWDAPSSPDHSCLLCMNAAIVSHLWLQRLANDMPLVGQNLDVIALGALSLVRMRV